MNTIATPYRIKLLLHFDCSPGPYPLSPIFQEEVDGLVEEGAIEPCAESGSGYKTTSLGGAWVQALCNVPPPKVVFVDQLGNILE